MTYRTSILTLCLLLPVAPAAAEELDLPWREAGLTEAQAAAHLLDRFAFGARPGDVERVVDTGLESWFANQLDGDLPDRGVDVRLKRFDSLRMTTREIVETYPNPGMVMREAQREGLIDRDGRQRPPGGTEEGETQRDGPVDDMATRRAVFDYARDQGYRPQRRLIGELMTQKLYRAVYSRNQLHEVLTDFWFNHFNVSLTDNECRVFIPTYERDAIRPHLTGDFGDMLEATARHPAMLLYLDNARSVADEGARVTFDREHLRDKYGRKRYRRGRGRGADSRTRQAFEQNRPQGLNENYARELLELHTLGVDGGYTQDDVVEVARAFTGWTTYPPGRAREEIERRIEDGRRRLARFGGTQNGGDVGYVLADDFLFRADAHDAGRKKVLGHRLAAGRGVEDGLEVLDLVAAHPSTARHLATKLAARFVSDEPPEALVDRLAVVYLDTGGDLRALVVALAESPEFWSPGARNQKIKSPFELAVSAVRVLDAEIVDPRELLEWISRMGQPLYAYQAPTGYPDRAEFWVNTGSLLSRMNFGLQLATGRVGGVELDLPALNGHREPESLDAALAAYVPLLLPERDPGPTVSRLEPVIRDPELASKIEETSPPGETADFGLDDWDSLSDRPERRFRRPERPPAPRHVDSSPLAHVVGVILGSPEFQRR